MSRNYFKTRVSPDVHAEFFFEDTDEEDMKRAHNRARFAAHVSRETGRRAPVSIFRRVRLSGPWSFVPAIVEGS